MKIDKVIFGVDDNPLYADFWPIQAKLVWEILGAQPVLIHITDHETDFYNDQYGLVKKIDKESCPGIITSFLSQIVRCYATKYFPDEVCLIGDIDMLMINKEYFLDQIKMIYEEDFVVYDPTAYDINRVECQHESLHSHERFPMCYVASKGKNYNKILELERPFPQYAHELGLMRLGWETDEIYLYRQLHKDHHGVNISKLQRNHSTPWLTEKRIERHNFPFSYSNKNEYELNQKYGVFNPTLINKNYYVDAHCPRPYKFCKTAIDSLLNLIPEFKKNIKISSYDYLNNRVNFKYTGLEETTLQVRISYRGMTLYSTEINIEPNFYTNYYVQLELIKKLEIDELFVEFKSQNVDEHFKISLENSNFKWDGINWSTDRTDTCYFTYDEIFVEKIYENNLVKVSKGDVVIDIGANYGFFSVFASQRGASKIYSYEPSKRVFNHLKQNILNGENIIPFNVAVSNYNGFSEFRDDQISSASSCLAEGEGDNIVRVKDINNIIQEKIDFLKIDCEGEELQIFSSLRSETYDKIRKLVVEYHNEETRNFIKEKLSSNFFEIESDRNSIIYAYNKKYMEQKKKVALISTFCNNQEKLQILKENIIKLKNLNIDVIAISPIPVPQDIVDMCDFFFFTKENPLLKWPVRMYTHWYEMLLPDGRISTMQRGLADYGWAGLYQVKKLTQIALTFDYDIFYHLIYDLEIDEVVESELISNNTNIIHPRRDPHHPETLWETTLHFMVFDRELMEKIEREITLDNYLGTNGVAEGEVLKWKKKYLIPGSNHPVKDKIFYWEDYDFFNYSPFKDFELFMSKNDEMVIWLGENPIREETLPDKFRMVFHTFDGDLNVNVIINGVVHTLNPKPWEYVEFDIRHRDIKEVILEYKGQRENLTKVYEDIMMNQVYYNRKP